MLSHGSEATRAETRNWRLFWGALTCEYGKHAMIEPQQLAPIQKFG